MTKDVIMFVKEHIIYRLRIPQKITIDERFVFFSEKFNKFVEEMGITLFNHHHIMLRLRPQIRA